MGSSSLQLEASIGKIASGQYGLVTVAQATAVGMSTDSLRRRARAGALIRMAPGVLRISGAPRSWHQRAMAVSLWLDGRGAVSGPTAAALHRLDGFGPPMVIECSVTRSVKPFGRQVKVRVSPFTLGIDRVQVGGICVTSPERTLIDLSRYFEEARIELALEDALRRRLTTPGDISRRLADLPCNLGGRGRLNRLLELRGAAPPAESALEVKMIRLLRDEGYPPPIRQKIIDDEGRFVGRVDLVFPERRLIIEVDSFRFHSGRVSWDKDRQRRNALSALGWIVIQATASMIDGGEREAFLRDLRKTYSRPL